MNKYKSNAIKTVYVETFSSNRAKVHAFIISDQFKIVISPLNQITKEEDEKYDFENNWLMLNIHKFKNLLILFLSNAMNDYQVWESDKFLTLEDPFFSGHLFS